MFTLRLGTGDSLKDLTNLGPGIDFYKYFLVL
jgi:hypothetical protein